MTEEFKPLQKIGDGYKWGETGKLYIGPDSKEKAIKQGRAIQVNKASDVQAIIFDKPKFNLSSAKKWAKSHGFKTYTDRETDNTIRLRQFPPDKCLRSGGMKDLDDGVQGYICPVPSKVKSILDELKSELDEIKKSLK